MSPTPSTPNQKFGTIQDYFKGNKAQGEQLGERFTGNLEQTKQQKQGEIGQAAIGAEQQIAANTIGADTGLISEAASDPTKIASSDDKMASFMKQWNAEYKGPQSFEQTSEYDKAAKAAQEAKSTSELTGTTGGRQQLLQDEFKVYGQGNKGLDEALLQQSSYFPVIGEKAKELSSLQDYLSTKSKDLSSAAETAKNTTAQTKQTAQDALLGETGATKQFKSDLEARTQAAREDATKKSQQYAEAFKSGDVAKLTDALKTANITDAQRTSILDYLGALNKDYKYNPDLSNAYSFNPATAVTAANVATPEDYKKAEAFQKLTGVDYSGVLSPNTADQAGKIGDPNAAINAEELNKNLQQYLVQKQKESLQPQPVTPTGSVETPESKPGILDKGGVADKALGGISNTMLTGIGAIPGMSGIMEGAGKVISKIGDSLGFGSKNKDAVVTLPELKLPDLAMPSTADAATTKLLVDIFNKPIKDAGSYHEGALGDIKTRLESLYEARQQGKLSPADYQKLAQPLAQWVENSYHTIMSASSAAANSVKGSYPDFKNKFGGLIGTRGPIAKAQ